MTCVYHSRTGDRFFSQHKYREPNRLIPGMGFFSLLPESYYSTLLPAQHEQTKRVLRDVFPDPFNAITIVDATAHIGGDTIHFATMFPRSKIIAVDVSQDAIACLKENVRKFIFKEGQVEVIKADTVKWINSNGQKADLYYFDPPWGGPNYTLKKKMNLMLGGRQIEEIILSVFEKGLTTTVMLKAPKNFSLEEFVIFLKGYRIKKYDIMKKNGIKVSHSLLVITKIFTYFEQAIE